jgi:glycerol-3-phosphate acyltransferase PlsY
MSLVVAAAVGYLLGSVPVSLLVARRRGVDLHRTGDGNPGAWNALEQLGARRAWPAFAGDGLKGALAALAGFGLGGFWGAYAGVAGAMAGHALPLFARFRGGKAVMTFAGGMCMLAPAAAAVCGTLGAAAAVATRSFAWGARIAVFGIAPVQLALDGAARTAATGVLMCFIGALFALRRRPHTSSRATSGRAAAPPA